LVLSLIQFISCDGNDRYSVQHRVGFEAARCLITVQPRQLDIHYNEVRAVGSRRGKPCLAIFSLNDLEISAREQIPQDLPIVWLTLNHEVALGHCYPVCASTRTGSVK